MSAGPSTAPYRETYERDKELAADLQIVARTKVARGRAAPEILYYLATDDSPDVRREVAANVHTPYQADFLLVHDPDVMVRADLAHKVSTLLPDLSPHEQSQACQRVTEIIEILARDQAVLVRQIVSETLKDVANAPPEVIRRLARDAEIVVAEPVLRFSPLLTDEDLLEIVMAPPAHGARTVIASRAGLAARVADAIVGAEDEVAVATLLANPTAQIREETLDQIIAVAPQHEKWHPPLVDRPALPKKLARRIASFVADHLLRRLEQRQDLPADTRAAVAEVVRTKLEAAAPSDEAPRKIADGRSAESSEKPKAAGTAAERGKPKAKAPAREGAEPRASETPEQRAKARVQKLLAEGLLDENAISTAIHEGDRIFVKTALAALAKVPSESVDRMFATRSTKGIVALVWKAGLSPRMATQIQLRIASIQFQQALAPRGDEWPLRPDEMEWHLEFFGV
jgi:Uncharacterised protein conserved in bacteria (DUF2336)